MSKPEWGAKRHCQSCGTKFYDLQRPQANCPSCGTEVDRAPPLKSRRSRSNAPKPAPVEVVKKPRPVETDEDGEQGEEIEEIEGSDLDDTDLDDDLGDDADDDVIEDTSELGDDDMSDVVTGKDSEEDDR